MIADFTNFRDQITGRWRLLRRARRIWICEYEAPGVPLPVKGSLAIEAKHPIGARQFAKHKLKKLLVKPGNFLITVRKPTLRESLDFLKNGL